MAKALLDREALRSLGQYGDADAVRSKLGDAGFSARYAEPGAPSSQEGGFFVMHKGLAAKHPVIVDRGWAPSFQTMQQYARGGQHD